MKTVATFPDLASAQLAQAMLEAEDIPAVIPDEHLAGLDWRMGNALGGVRLQVAPEHAEQATALLGQAAPIDQSELVLLAKATEAPTDRDVCPSCGSGAIAAERSTRRAKALTMLFFPALLLWPLFARRRNRLKCSSCGQAWSPGS